ncbi:MAG: hypothetical protein Phyf2KO_04180 [Phycisphaerales bacterium]
MKRRALSGTLILLAGFGIASDAVSQHRDGGEPNREQLRERLTAELERTRERERWLMAKLESVNDNSIELGPQLDRDRREENQGRPGQERLPMSEEVTKRMISLLRDIHAHDPSLEADSPFRRVLDNDTDDRRRLLQRMAPKLHELLKLRESNNEKYELRRDEMIAGFAIARAARRLGVAMHQDEVAPGDIESAKQALHDAISRGFDAKAAVTKYELGEVERKLEKLSHEIDSAENERAERIESHYEAMLLRIENNATHGNEIKPDMHRERRRPSRND